MIALNVSLSQCQDLQEREQQPQIEYSKRRDKGLKGDAKSSSCVQHTHTMLENKHFYSPFDPLLPPKYIMLRTE